MYVMPQRKKAASPSPASPINIELDKILNSLDYGYTYRMSDYATSREAEEKYESEGLAEIAQAKEAILALINQAVVGELEDVLVKLAIAVGGANPVTNIVADRLAELRGSGVQNPTHNGDGEAS